MFPIRDDNPTSTFPFVTIFIIAVNALVFVYQLSLAGDKGEFFVLKTAAIPYEISHLVDVYPTAYLRPPLTLITSLFVHGGIMHIGGNMLYLWIFGDNIEDRVGHFRFAVFYIGTGIIASLAHIATIPDSNIPLIGASGAIAGILGAYFRLFPKANVVTLIFLFVYVEVVKIPAVIFLGLWFIFQILGIGGGPVAWFAHIGGFVAGLFLIKLFDTGKKRIYNL